MTLGRPQRAFAILVTVAVASMVLGVLLGRAVRSPAQQLADAAPPELSVITAEVSERELSGEIVVRGTVAVGRTVSVGPVASSDALSVVTKVAVEPGDQAKVGASLIEVSGRPVFLLRGEFPAYRDLKVGDEGPDAEALNAALDGLKLAHGEGAEFTTDTSDGLATLYRKAGYEPSMGGGLDLREVVFVPASTASVLSVGARVGETSEAEALVVLAAGETVVTATVPPQDAAAIEVGNEATIHLDDGTTVAAEVTSVESGDTLATTVVSLRPDEALDAALNEADLRVVIQQTSTATSVLTVPVPAVFSQADGQPVVVRVDAAGAREVVPVTVGDIVGGFAEVTAAGGGAPLSQGDEVIVSGPGLES